MSELNAHNSSNGLGQVGTVSHEVVRDGVAVPDCFCEMAGAYDEVRECSAKATGQSLALTLGKCSFTKQARFPEHRFLEIHKHASVALRLQSMWDEG